MPEVVPQYGAPINFFGSKPDPGESRVFPCGLETSLRQLCITVTQKYYRNPVAIHEVAK